MLDSRSALPILGHMHLVTFITSSITSIITFVTTSSRPEEMAAVVRHDASSSQPMSCPRTRIDSPSTDLPAKDALPVPPGLDRKPTQPEQLEKEEEEEEELWRSAISPVSWIPSSNQGTLSERSYNTEQSNIFTQPPHKRP
ncbi:unnamed protein product [Diplocarpon coronariae]|nr:hypothetical protein JHW43_001370 [Diplocarpon mali]